MIESTTNRYDWLSSMTHPWGDVASGALRMPLMPSTAARKKLRVLPPGLVLMRASAFNGVISVFAYSRPDRGAYDSVGASRMKKLPDK